MAKNVKSKKRTVQKTVARGYRIAILAFATLAAPIGTTEFFKASGPWIAANGNINAPIVGTNNGTINNSVADTKKSCPTAAFHIVGGGGMTFRNVGTFGILTVVSIWKIPAATSLKISWHAVDRPPLPRTVGPASSCAQLHNSLGGGNDPQGEMEGGANTTA